MLSASAKLTEKKVSSESEIGCPFSYFDSRFEVVEAYILMTEITARSWSRVNVESQAAVGFCGPQIEQPILGREAVAQLAVPFWDPLGTHADGPTARSSASV